MNETTSSAPGTHGERTEREGRAAPPALLTERPCSLSRWDVPPPSPSRRRGKRRYLSVMESLARAGDQACGDVWLWCRCCHRFLQAKHLEYDFAGGWQGCPFDDCSAAGFEIGIVHWTSGGSDPRWPASEHELYPGLQYPPHDCPRCSADNAWRASRQARFARSAAIWR